MTQQTRRKKSAPVRPTAKKYAHKRPERQQRPSQEIVVRPPSPKPWLLSPDEVTVLKNSICKGATDEELKYCVAVARRYELDPFQNQIYFTPRWDSEAERTDGKKGATVYVPVVGINGMLHLAARDHADFGTYSEPEYGPMMEVRWQYKGQGDFKKLSVPEWCRIEAWKKGAEHPTVAKVWWSEIYPNIDFSPLVRRMPRLMLAKCAKAQATRTSYPKTGGLLIPEETQSREFTDITQERRLISRSEAAERRYNEREKEQVSKLTPEQQEVLKNKMAQAEAKADATPCLFYCYFKASDRYEITGSDELKTANRDLLKPLYDPTARTILTLPGKPGLKQLAHLIRQFEELKVPFRELKAVQ